MHDDLTNQMSDGIDCSRLVAVFITTSYIRKVQGLGPSGLDDACKAEFDYSVRRHGVGRMVPIVMEAGCRNTNEWTGGVGFRMGSQLYIDLSDDDKPDPAKLKQLADNIHKRLSMGMSRSFKFGSISMSKPVKYTANAVAQGVAQLEAVAQITAQGVVQGVDAVAQGVAQGVDAVAQVAQGVAQLGRDSMSDPNPDRRHSTV